MNLEHTRVIKATGIERLDDLKMLVQFVEQEAAATRQVKLVEGALIKALADGDTSAAADWAEISDGCHRYLDGAKRWADNYRAKVRENIKQEQIEREAQFEVQA